MRAFLVITVALASASGGIRPLLPFSGACPRPMRHGHVGVGAMEWSANRVDTRRLMPRKTALSKTMTTAQFDRGYWYATELAQFAAQIGIPHSTRLRKDELEAAIRTFLGTGRIVSPPGRPRPASKRRDVEKGLSLDLPVVNYVNDRETKRFLVTEAARLAPAFKERSGARYRLNRWREEQLANGRRLTYGDLVRRYVELSLGGQRYDRIPHARYINFIADYFATEEDAAMADATRAWNRLKALDIPKTYAAWKAHETVRRGDRQP